MTETHTPLPCPFCSGDAIIIHEDRVWIECADCPSKAEVGPFDTEAEALTAWNARAVNSHHDLIEALRGVMDILGRAESNASGNPEWDYVGPRVAKARAILTKEAGR